MANHSHASRSDGVQNLTELSHYSNTDKAVKAMFEYLVKFL